MWIFNFYRLYASLAAGTLAWLLLEHPAWLAALETAAFRFLWLFFEQVSNRIIVERDFRRNAAPFKELFGPYGIRLINKAETDRTVKNSLAEVFTKNRRKLEQAVSTLELMETFYSSGMRPDGDSWQLHDLKLKYGKHRLAKETGPAFPQ